MPWDLSFIPNRNRWVGNYCSWYWFFCFYVMTTKPIIVFDSFLTFYFIVTVINLNAILKLQTPRIVSLLSESYNPHVRYGAALAVGISCAGTGLSEAISLLEPLTSDVVDFVRQGALIAMAMVMVQTSEASDSRVGAFR